MELTTIPFPEPTEIGGRSVARKNATLGAQAISIDLDLIDVIEGFNGRTVFEGIEELAASIEQNEQTNPGLVRALNNGRFALIQGERRFRAHLLNSKKGIVKKFVAFVADKDCNEVDLLLRELITQQGSALKDFEVAGIIQRLLNFDMSQKQIAERLGKPAVWVSNMIQYARVVNSSPEVKEAVIAGKASKSTVVSIGRKRKPELAAEIIASQAKVGKVKLPPKEVNDVDAEPLVKSETKYEACAREISDASYLPYDFALSIIHKHFKQQ